MTKNLDRLILRDLASKDGKLTPRIYRYERHPVPFLIESKFYATGSGACFCTCLYVYGAHSRRSSKNGLRI